MAEKPYAKRELDHYFSDLFKRMDKQDLTLERVEKQTTATSGRVTKLEWWQKAVIWGLGALWGLVLLSVSIGVPIWRDVVKNRMQNIDNLNEKVNTLFSQYDKVIINNK